MTLDGFDEIAAAWSPILKANGFRIELKAVFCHSRPQVLFSRVPSPFASPKPQPGRCELADLLVVIDYVKPGPKTRERRAVLIQAKLLKGGQIKPSGREWIQHELLAWWPSFTFVEAAYDTRQRDFTANPLVGFPGMSAEYGGIELQGVGNSAEWQNLLPFPQSPCFRYSVPFSDFLADMATGSADCSREAVAGGSDDWSFTVDELLKVTAAKPIVKAMPGVLRGNVNVVGLIVDTSAQTSGDGGAGADEGEMTDWPDGPISTVQLTIRPLDDRDDDLDA